MPAPFAPLPTTSQGYPFAKNLNSYDAEALGRASFADGVVAALAGLHLYDAGGMYERSPLPPTLFYNPCLHHGWELLLYV